MHASPPDNAQLRAGIWISALSIGWTLVASTASIALGFASSNLVLVAFGFTGLLDAAGSTALVVHFRHALRHDEFSERHERIALAVVTGGLIAVASITAIESIRRLIAGTHGEATAAGIGIAGVSVVVFATLAYRKRVLGKAVPSPALVADSWLSLTGALLALVAVIGTLLSSIGWWWADPVAALVVAMGALAIGVFLRRQAPDDNE